MTACGTERLVDRCRERGMKVTPQRLAIYEAVAATQAHPGAEEVFRTVKAGMPHMSLATVYKTLDFLEEIELIACVASEGRGRRYDANLTPHHHLWCVECGSITDLVDATLDAVRPRRRLGGFKPKRISVQVSGVCASCVASAGT